MHEYTRNPDLQYSACHILGTSCAHWVSCTDRASRTAQITGRASEAWVVSHKISKRRLMWPD
eukprot:10306544-Ditylum_brightwellii.AAC.1